MSKKKVKVELLEEFEGRGKDRVQAEPYAILAQLREAHHPHLAEAKIAHSASPRGFAQGERRWTTLKRWRDGCERPIAALRGDYWRRLLAVARQGRGHLGSVRAGNDYRAVARELLTNPPAVLCVPGVVVGGTR